MSRDNLNYAAMTADRAADIVSHIVREKERWGKHYDASDVGLEAMMQALVFMAKEGSEETQNLRESVKLLNRQLAASNARETKLKRELKEARDGSSDAGADASE